MKPLKQTFQDHEVDTLEFLKFYRSLCKEVLVETPEDMTERMRFTQALFQKMPKQSI